MTELEMVLRETQSLGCKIKDVLCMSTYDQYDDLSGLDIDYKDGEQLFLLEEMQTIMKSLDDVRRRLKYLSLPVREVSRLHRNESGRYETDRGHYYTNGSPIGLYFKGSPEEITLIEQKMEQAGTGNKRAYLRKMAVDGYIVRLDMGDMGQLVKLLRSIAGNMNQIARRCNETGNLYGEDVEDLRKGYVTVQRAMSVS